MHAKSFFILDKYVYAYKPINIHAGAVERSCELQVCSAVYILVYMHTIIYYALCACGTPGIGYTSPCHCTLKQELELSRSLQLSRSTQTHY